MASTIFLRFKGDPTSAIRAGILTRNSINGVSGAGARLGRILSTTVVAGTAAFAYGIAKAVQITGDFEQSLNTFQAVSRATGDQMDRVSGLAKQLGADLTLPATSAKDAADTMTELAKGGLSVRDSMAAARGAIQLSTAAQIENAEAATIVADALNAFNLRGRESNRVADLLAASANATTAEITDMALALKQSSAVAQQLGIPIEEVVTLLGELANRGIKGSDAGTSLRTMLLRLGAPTAKAKQVMDDLGVSVFNAAGQMLPMPKIIEQFSKATKGMSDEQRSAAFLTIFGTDAIRAANIVLRGGLKAHDDMAKAVGRQGAAADLAAARMKGYRGAVEGFKSTMETFAITIGTKALPKATDFVNALSHMVGWLDRIVRAPNADVRVRLIAEGLDDFRDKVAKALFGGTERVRVPIEGGRFELQTKESQGLVDSIAKGIEAVDWGMVTKAIAKGLIHAAGDAAHALHDWAQENVTPENFIRLVGLDPDHDYGHDIDQFMHRQLNRFFASFKPNWGNLRNLGPVPFGDEIRRSLSAVTNWIRSRWRGLLIGAVRSGFSPLPGLARAALDRARAAITSRVASWGAAAGRLAERVVTAIDNRLGRLPSRVGRYIGRAATEVGRHISEFFHAAVMLGEAIVNGIVSGLGGLISAVGSKIANSIKSAIDWAKKNVSSTAAEYAQVQLGDPIMQGIVNGVNKGQPILAAALRRSIRGAINRAGIDRFSQIAQQIFSGRQAAAMTPAERQIAAIERRRELDQLQSALTDALAGGDKAAIAAAQEDIRLFQLREQAERQRAALEQRQFLASLRFQRALERLTHQIEKGNLTAAQERRRVRRFIHQFNLNIKGGGLSRADKAQLAKELGPYMSQAIGYVVEAQ